MHNEHPSHALGSPVGQAPPDNQPERQADPVLPSLPADPQPLRFYAKQLDVAGKYKIDVARGDREYGDVIYVDEESAVKHFITTATGKLAEPHEDTRDLKREIKHRLCQTCGHFLNKESRPLIIPLSESIATKVDWLWPNRIALGKLTILVGDPGVGKSLVALDIAARVSLGNHWPDDSVDDYPPEPGGVLILSEQDDIKDTLLPRLDAIGSNMTQIHVVQSFRKVDSLGRAETVPFSHEVNFEMISACIRKIPRCKLVILDPLSTYLGVKPTRDELAGCMRGLVDLAARHNVAVLATNHYSRSEHALFHCGAQGQANFGSVARSVWKIVGDTDHPERRVLLPLKNNLASDWSALRFRIASLLAHSAPTVRWEKKPLAVKVARATYKAQKDRAIPNTRQQHRQMIRLWLHLQLCNGERFAQDVYAAAAPENIGIKTLREVLRELGGTSRKGSTGLWVWSLPSEVSPPLAMLPDAS
jgi:hypothetical protein